MSIIVTDFLEDNYFLLLYVFSTEEGKQKFIEVKIPRDKPKIQSIYKICDSAFWHEQEMSELFGVKFIGHPRGDKHLLLRDDWTSGYPHRKDYVVEHAY